MKLLLLIISFIVVIPCFSQGPMQNDPYVGSIATIINADIYGDSVLRHLEVSTRSNIVDYFNRDIDLGFKHRRLFLQLNYVYYQIDLLCKQDSIFLFTISNHDKKKLYYQQYNNNVIGQFLEKRNTLYGSSKSARQLTEEISLGEVYAFHCGFVDQKTQKGYYIDTLVAKRDSIQLLQMLKSFHCETQAYGVAGFSLLKEKNVVIPVEAQTLIDRIKKRNSELVTCSGCLMGLISKIYTTKEEVKKGRRSNKTPFR
jgi:hypothetical protein